MKYGIVQEVMKIEERKAVRREAALRPSPAKREDSDNSAHGPKPMHSPRPGSPNKKNKDLTAHLSDSRRRFLAQQPKKFLDASTEDPRQKSRSRLGIHDSTDKLGDKKTPLGSAMKHAATASVSGFGGSEAVPKKKTINFGDSGSVDNLSRTGKSNVPKDAPTIGNPLMMRMER